MAPLSLTSGRAPVAVTLHFSPRPNAIKKPVVVITHHFGGNEQTSRRHVELLNQIGFDCATFLFSDPNPFKVKNWAFPVPLFKRWQREIGEVLEQIPAREKILLSFSGPAAPALALIAEHVTAGSFDIVAFIVDSGPFVDARLCTRNMIEQLYGIKTPVKRELFLAAMMLVWGPNHDRMLLKAAQSIARVAPELPILSFRGTLDSIVPAEKIAAVFDQKGFKNLTVANLETGHLTGLKELPAPYQRVLNTFLGPWSLH